MYMAASLGLAHEACYGAAYPPATAAVSSSYFPSPPPAPPVATPAAATGMADDYYYFQFGEEMGGGGYCSPPAPVFDNGMNFLGYGGGGVDGDGRMRTMSGPGAGAGGNGGGRRASRIGFRTRSEVDVLDDGFKWRKYGKKAVKSSPNPRNYYRCSAEGCGVKKRVERDSDDPRYVITTYDGVHNHTAPGAAVAYLCPPPPPPRGANRPTATTPCFSPPRSAASSAPHHQMVAAPPSWSAAFDAWEAQLHAGGAGATGTAAYSSESSY